METEIKILKSGDLEDFRQLLSVFDIVFEYDPYTRPDDFHLRNLLEKDSFKVFVARSEGKVVAGPTAYVLDQYHTDKPILYIQDLAVLREYQRKGIGTKLMESAHEYSRQTGFQQVFIQAEKEDNSAVAFYRSTKPTGELQAFHFYYTLGH